MVLDQLFGLEGRTAFITGGAGGLGMAQARALGGAGARLVLADKDQERVERAKSDLAGDGLEVSAVVLDLLDVSAIDSLFERLRQAGTIPDIVVNNAGISLRNSALEATEAEFDVTFGVNAKGPYFVAQAAARLMKEAGGGCIVNIASIGAYVIDGERSSVYDASKSAIAHMTTNMAYEWAPFGIRVNAIAPGYIHTAMTEGLLPDPEVEQRLVDSRIPLGRVGEPEDLAGAIVFLCSPSASWITGHAVVVDGGWMANF